MNRRSLLLILLMVFVGFGALGFWWSQHPTFALAQAARCFISKERVCFDRFVDFQSVGQGLVDDFERLVLKSLGVDPQQADSAGALAQMLLGGLRTEARKVVDGQLDAYFAKGDPIGDSGPASSLNGAVLFYLSQQSDFSVSWKLDVQTEGDLSLVTFFATHKPTQKRFPIRVKLQKTSGAWRVVRVYDLLENYISFEAK